MSTIYGRFYAAANMPMVVYHGERRWSAGEDLFGPVMEVPARVALARYRPRQGYHVLDAGAWAAGDLPENSRVSALVGLESGMPVS